MSPRGREAVAEPAVAAPLWHYLAILLLPALLSLVNPNWAFQSIGHMDAWYYFGDFHHFPRFQLLSPNYASERIPWILPGFVLVRIFGQVNGVFALHCLVLTGTLLCTHYLLRHVAGARTALLGAMLLGCYPCFIGANGWEYVDSIQLLLLSASLALLGKAGRAPATGALWQFLAGVAWSGILYVFVPWAAFTPIYLGLAVYLTRGAQTLVRTALRVASISLAAFGFTTAALWGAYLLLGGRGFFFQQNLTTARSMSKLSGNPWIDPYWYREPTWLVVPALALGLAILWLGASAIGWVGVRRPGRWVLWFYLLCFAVMIALTFDQNRLLASDHHMSIILPVTYLVLCVTVLRVPEATPPALFHAIVVLGCAVSLSTLPVPGSYHLLLHWQALGALGVAIPALGLYSWRGGRRGAPVAWVASVLALAAMSSALIPGYPSAAWKRDYRGRDIALRVTRAMDVVMDRLPLRGLPVFWFDNRTEPLAAEFRAITCSLLAHSQSMPAFPTLDPAHPPAGWRTPVRADRGERRRGHRRRDPGTGRCPLRRAHGGRDSLRRRLLLDLATGSASRRNFQREIGRRHW